MTTQRVSGEKLGLLPEAFYDDVRPLGRRGRRQV